jgi:carboxylate-amine ligase
MPCAEEVAAAAHDLDVELHAEVTGCQVEIANPPCANLHHVREHLLTARAAAVAAALRCDARLLAAGVPPVGPLRQPIGADHGLLAAEHAVCGCHVHVEVPDGETAAQVVDHLRPWLPVLLALTANSAVHQGVDTGYASWRSVLAGRDEKTVDWDARPSSDRPTVEVRVSDVPATVNESTLLAGLVRALVVTAIRDIDAGRAAPAVSGESLRMAYWRAGHDGLTGRGVDLSCDRPVPAVDLLRRLLRHVRPALVQGDELQRTKSLVSKVLTQGNGAVGQRRALLAARTPADLVDTLSQHTLQDWWPHHAA